VRRLISEAALQLQEPLLEEVVACPPEKYRTSNARGQKDCGVTQRRGGRAGDIGQNGQFAINDVMPGFYSIRAGAPRGWTMKAVYLDGREVTDAPIEVKSENVTGLNVIFTDRISSLGGSVRDTRGNPIGDVAVIAFPADERLWSPQSRQIMTARTDRLGAYKLASIPPGEYLVVAVDDVEPGEWFDPVFLDLIRGHATKVRIEEGQQHTQDLKAPVM